MSKAINLAELRKKITQQYKLEKEETLLAVEKRYRKRMRALEKMARVLGETIAVDIAEGKGGLKPRYGNIKRVAGIIRDFKTGFHFTSQDVYEIAKLQETHTKKESVGAAVCTLLKNGAGTFSKTNETVGKQVVYARV